MGLRFARHRGGAAAVEFAVLGMVFVTLLLGCIQFSLYFVASLRMRSVLAETVAYASVFSNTKFFAETRDANKVRDALCEDLILAENCKSTLKIEQMPLASMGKAAQPITGAQFTTGSPGDVLVRRAEVPIMTFVPGVKPLRVRGTSIFLRR